MIVRRMKTAPNKEWKIICQRYGLDPDGLFKASESVHKGLIVITAACGSSPLRYSSIRGETSLWASNRFHTIQE